MVSLLRVVARDKTETEVLVSFSVHELYCVGSTTNPRIFQAVGT